MEARDAHILRLQAKILRLKQKNKKKKKKNADHIKSSELTAEHTDKDNGGKQRSEQRLSSDLTSNSNDDVQVLSRLHDELENCSNDHYFVSESNSNQNGTKAVAHKSMFSKWKRKSRSAIYGLTRATREDVSTATTIKRQSFLSSPRLQDDRQPQHGLQCQDAPPSRVERQFEPPTHEERISPLHSLFSDGNEKEENKASHSKKRKSMTTTLRRRAAVMMTIGPTSGLAKEWRKEQDKKCDDEDVTNKEERKNKIKNQEKCKGKARKDVRDKEMKKSLKKESNEHEKYEHITTPDASVLDYKPLSARGFIQRHGTSSAELGLAFYMVPTTLPRAIHEHGITLCYFAQRRN